LSLPILPFDWNSHFVPEGDSEDCIPACLAMAGRYWKSVDKTLGIPSKLDDWMAFLDSLHVTSHRGTNLVMLKSALRKIKKDDGVGLSIRMIQPQKLADVTKFLEEKIPIPVILCYDRSLAINNVEGPNHASLLYSIDLVKEQIKVVDPSQIYRQTPMLYSQEDFIRGWNAVQNQIIIIFPSNLRVPINTRKQDESQNLDEWNETK
jgi:hypothetical protein